MLTVANLAVTVGRFVALRTWVFVRRRRVGHGEFSARASEPRAP